MSELKQPVSIPQVIADHSVKYKERRRKQMMLFFGATATTLLFARIAHRGVQSRRCEYKEPVNTPRHITNTI